MAESEEELKTLLINMKKQNEKAGLKFSIQKMKIIASSPITSWQIDGETMESVTDFIFLGSKIIADKKDLKKKNKTENSLLTENLHLMNRQIQSFMT